MRVCVYSRLRTCRGPEYVRTVVECYKEAIKAYLDDTFTDEKIAAWDERLKQSLTVAFGMATIWDNAWANGHGIMVRPLRNVNLCGQRYQILLQYRCL